LNTYGVAEVQTAGARQPREIELIRGLGVEFRYESEIRTQQDLEQLEREFDRLLSGVGLGAAHRLGIPATTTATSSTPCSLSPLQDG